MKSFDQYVQLMAELLEVPEVENINAESSLYADWGIDSLQAFELIIMTEQLAGLTVPPPEVPPLFSLGDAYSYYGQCLESARQADD